MALRDEIRQEQEKLKGRPLKEKVGYVWHYYGLLIMIGVIGVVALISIIRGFLSQKESVLTVMIVNRPELMEDVSGVLTLLEDAVEPDPKKQEVLIRENMYFSEKDVLAVQKLMGISTAGEADLYLADEAFTEYCGELGLFAPLTDSFTGEELEAYGEKVIFVSGVPTGLQSKEGILSIALTAPHPETAKKAAMALMEGE